jgi:hypothetical protein
MTFEASICVRYKFVDGWHVFQSEDVDGLYVASTDARKAFEDVAPSIELLMKLNEGVQCKAVPAMELRDFVATLRQQMRVAEVPVTSDKRFVLTGAIA